MKKTITLFILGLSLLTTPIISQSSSFSIGELDPYFGEYLKPVALGMATGMGSGWAHEARPHKTLGFDLSVSVVGVQIPTSDMKFSTSKLSGMTDNGYAFTDKDNGGAIDMLPTMSSPDDANANISKTLSSGAYSQDVVVSAINGMNVPYAPNVSLQLAIGLPKGTEIIGRYVPEVGETINEYAGLDDISVDKVNMWGVGLKHDIKQWIPVVSKIPLLEISALLAYSEFNFAMTSSTIALDPRSITEASGLDPDADLVENVSGDYSNQGFAMEMNSFTGSLMVGANIPVIRPFVAVGFNKASVSTGLTGMYPIMELNQNPSLSSTHVFEVNEVEENPLYLEAEKTFVNFQAGLNIKIAILTLHAQYTYQQYSMYSAGVAIGIR